jgi:prepilin-type N-terminal cleavage/methylation domain-containing protein
MHAVEQPAASQRARVRAQAGFTLIELMVVVAIVTILGALLMGVASRPYGANAQNLSEQLSTTLGFARTRAIATRHTHKVTIYNTTSGTRAEQIVSIEANQDRGTRTAGTYNPIEYRRINSNSIIWSATTGIPATNASPAQNTGFPFSIYFRPDGSVSSSSTIYLTDRMGTPKRYRLVVVQATGSTYARQTW